MEISYRIYSSNSRAKKINTYACNHELCKSLMHHEVHCTFISWSCLFPLCNPYIPFLKKGIHVTIISDKEPTFQYSQICHINFILTGKCLVLSYILGFPAMLPAVHFSDSQRNQRDISSKSVSCFAPLMGNVAVYKLLN